MASIEAESATLTVGEVAALGDAELVQFMKRHRNPHGGYELPVDGWEELSKDERDRLADRLRAQERILGQSPTDISHTLDLDDLDTRLRRLPSHSSFSLPHKPQAATPSDSPTVSVDFEAEGIADEKEAYQSLIDDGGRPFYHLDLLTDVARNSEVYDEMLQPWQFNYGPERFPGAPWKIFGRQLRRWRHFRKWQNNNRGLEDDDGGFPAYVERQKVRIKRIYLEKPGAKLLAKIEADPSYFKLEWDEKQLRRRREQRLFREHGCEGFRDYEEAVKGRLARHGFTRPLELREDPKQQDKLMTWIEYFNYEYWWLDKHTSDLQRLGPHHDRAWQTLIDEKVLRPYETEEALRTLASVMDRQAKEDEAMTAVQRLEDEAKSIYYLTQEDPLRESIPRSQRVSMMKDCSTKLLAAKRWLQQIKNRNKQISTFIRDTRDHARAKEEVARQTTLVDWVREEVPAVEAELTRSVAAMPGPGKISRPKRKLTTDTEPPRERYHKRPKLDRRKSRPSAGSCGAAGPEALAHQQGGRDDGDAGKPASRKPRRSARIAARQGLSEETPVPAITRERRRPKSRRKPPGPQRNMDSRRRTKARRR